jgi:hypothetical protein
MVMPGARSRTRTTLTVALLLAFPAGFVALARCEACSASRDASVPANELCGSHHAVTVRCPMPCCTFEVPASELAATLSEPQPLPGPLQDVGGRSPAVAFLGIGNPRTGSNTLSHPAPAQARGAPCYLLDSSFLL